MEPNPGHSPAPGLRTRGFQPPEHRRLMRLTVPESQLSTTGWRRVKKSLDSTTAF